MHVSVSTTIPDTDLYLLVDALRAWHLARPADHAPLLLHVSGLSLPSGGLLGLQATLEPDMYLRVSQEYPSPH